MDNCLDIYGAKLRLNRSSVYSVRRDGERVAVIEIGPHQEDHSKPALLQLRARRNRRASADLWNAAYLWLGARQSRQAPSPLPSGARVRAGTLELWKPYLDWQAAYGGDARMQTLVLGEFDHWSGNRATRKRPPRVRKASAGATARNPSARGGTR